MLAKSVLNPVHRAVCGVHTDMHTRTHTRTNPHTHCNNASLCPRACHDISTSDLTYKHTVSTSHIETHNISSMCESEFEHVRRAYMSLNPLRNGAQHIFRSVANKHRRREEGLYIWVFFSHVFSCSNVFSFPQVNKRRRQEAGLCIHEFPPRFFFSECFSFSECKQAQKAFWRSRSLHTRSLHTREEWVVVSHINQFV